MKRLSFVAEIKIICFTVLFNVRPHEPKDFNMGSIGYTNIPDITEGDLGNYLVVPIKLEIRAYKPISLNTIFCLFVF